MRPLAVDLFSGLGGWAEGLEAEGYDVIRVDIEDMFLATGTPKPDPCLLMLQDVMTIHGSQFKHVDLIVASPPCQEYSYMAMPWSLAKAKAERIRADTTGEALKKLTALFDACFRIQREACEAAGRYIPMVIENVRGANPWVGRAVDNYGSYYLWGDVPSLPEPVKARKYNPDGTNHPPGSWFAIADSKNRGANSGLKVPGFRFDGSGGSFQTASVNAHIAHIGGPRHEAEGIKQGGTWFHDNKSASRMSSSKSKARKAASAQIAKIPLRLSRHIGRVFHPDNPNQLDRIIATHDGYRAMLAAGSSILAT